ncbi:hypothetical protein JB92DRAFT_3106721 [Gautieria morchelliformis]|nr:hypothetical protein JB92DRAFT_3106721 [Gautieria morchelliformis]
MMELDPRHYARYRLDAEALETWRQHSCLPKVSRDLREAFYTAARPFFEQAIRNLIQYHSWRQIEHESNVLFCVQSPSSDAILALPDTCSSLFEHARPCERMFEALFQIEQDANDGRLFVAEPLADIFHLLQLLVPGCLSLVKAEYASHDVDDDGEIAWITWRTYARALPPPSWMDLHAQASSQIVAIFGSSQWAILRRAAADSEVLASGDITFE